MPGFVEQTLCSGYGYIDPYVERARINIPLVDRVGKKAEEYVPPLVSRVDEFAEHQIEALKPKVEPIISKSAEQVREARKVMTPYVDGGIRKVEEMRTEGAKIYNSGIEKVEQVKKRSDSKVSELQSFALQKMAKLREMFMSKGDELQKLALQQYSTKVPKCVQEDVSKLASKLKEVYSIIETTFLEKKKKAFELYVTAKDFLKTKKEQLEISSKSKFQAKAEEVKATVLFKNFVAKAQAAQKTAAFEKSVGVGRKGVNMAVAGCNKIMGEEKTKAMMSKLEELVPSFWKPTQAATVSRAAPQRQGSQPVVVPPRAKKTK